MLLQQVLDCNTKETRRLEGTSMDSFCSNRRIKTFDHECKSGLRYIRRHLDANVQRYEQSSVHVARIFKGGMMSHVAVLQCFSTMNVRALRGNNTNLISCPQNYSWFDSKASGTRGKVVAMQGSIHHVLACLAFWTESTGKGRLSRHRSVTEELQRNH